MPVYATDSTGSFRRIGEWLRSLWARLRRRGEG